MFTVKLQFVVEHKRCLRLHIGQVIGPIASDLKTTVNDELKGELTWSELFYRPPKSEASAIIEFCTPES